MKRNGKRYERILFGEENVGYSRSLWQQFSSVRINLASPEKIMEWSHGEVTKAETLSYRTLRPVPDGLHCERIFGPYVDWECGCGKYQGRVYKSIVCEECHVQIDSTNVRRSRLGHITLEEPVVHTWYYASNSNNPICTILDITHKSLLDIVFFRKFIYVNNAEDLSITLIDENTMNNLTDKQKESVMEGPEGLAKILSSLNLKALLLATEKKISLSTARQRIPLLRRRIAIRDWIGSESIASSMIIKYLPVLPAGLRPIITLESGALGSSDVNLLYRSVLLRNRRLKMLKSLQMPRMILVHEKVLLQQAVDALIDNEKSAVPITTRSPEKRMLKSLTDVLRGKKGLLRMNLLGKRIDFSARSVIVVDPSLHLNQCGIPRLMALELYKPFLLYELIKNDVAKNMRDALMLVDTLSNKIWSSLEKVVMKRPVLLNRAPTLHRQSIQAFDVVLVDGYAIRIHPLVCEGFNADFDGDQMAVYLCVLPAAALEAKILMSSIYNIFSHSNGRAVIKPVREILLGIYWITTLKNKGEPRMYIEKKHALDAWKNNRLEINEEIKISVNGELVSTNVGRIMINNLLPEEVRNYSITFTSKVFDNILFSVYESYGFQYVANLLDSLKNIGFERATMAALSMSLKDIKVPEAKAKIISDASLIVAELQTLYEKNKITEAEKRIRSMDVWNGAIEEVTAKLYSQFSPFNDLYVAINSGARGNLLQARQLCGCRGLISDANGVILSTPVLSSYAEGLQPFEYFMSSYGARKGIIDRTLKTANAGYLTRRLVDVAHGVFVSEYDCGTEKHVVYGDIKVFDNSLNGIDRTFERVLAQDISVAGLELKRNTIITREHINIMKKNNVKTLPIRSVITCEALDGICALCYGTDMTRHKIVDVGTTVGIIAAQSVGEPATQLTMRTFHTGGVASRKNTVHNIKSSSAGSVDASSVRYNEWKNDAILFKGMCTKAGVIKIGENSIEVQAGDILCVNHEQNVNVGDVVIRREEFTSSFFANANGILHVPKEVMFLERDSYGREIIRLNEGSNGVSLYIDKNKVIVPNNSILRALPESKIKAGDVIAVFVIDNIRTADIVDDLPRVEAILEMRNTDKNCIVSDVSGVISVEEQSNETIISVMNNDEVLKKWIVPSSQKVMVSHGDVISRGENITDGTPNFEQLSLTFENYEISKLVVDNVKKLYMNNNIIINEKHLEIIASQMFRLVRIKDCGDSEILPNEIVPVDAVLSSNKELVKKGKVGATYTPLLSGISKVSASATSFLSAASFQQTKRILAASAIKGATDTLKGIKENVVVGNAIPCGTAFRGIKSVRQEDNIFSYLRSAFDVLEKALVVDEDILNRKNWIDEIIEATNELRDLTASNVNVL